MAILIRHFFFRGGGRGEIMTLNLTRVINVIDVYIASINLVYLKKIQIIEEELKSKCHKL